ncbi:MAG TPA: hypothetical protein PK200_00625 [Spirochaetota bacterium]|nr:hypothetical protein [Spirochaetota bacterium]
MSPDLKKLYEELKKNLHQERLKDISADIISRYKKRDIDALSWYGTILEIPADTGINKLFAALIQTYHPDKFSKIRREMENLFANGNTQGLLKMKERYIFSERKIIPTADFSVFSEESYDFGEDDFGYGEEMVDSLYDFEEPEDASEEYVYEEEFGFIEALNLLLFGNLSFVLTSDDMQHLQGEINLSDYDIEELNGIEHCINVISFNLSCNHIRKLHYLAYLTKLESLFLSENLLENINDLGELVNLRELDISYNEIEDISVLLRLNSLEYVNIMGNLVRDMAVIEELTERGVIVIH